MIHGESKLLIKILVDMFVLFAGNVFFYLNIKVYLLSINYFSADPKNARNYLVFYEQVRRDQPCMSIRTRFSCTFMTIMFGQLP